MNVFGSSEQIQNRRIALETCQQIRLLNQFNISSFFSKLFLASPQIETKKNHLNILLRKLQSWTKSGTTILLPNLLKLLNIVFTENPPSFPDLSSQLLCQTFIYFYSYSNQVKLREDQTRYKPTKRKASEKKDFKSNYRLCSPHQSNPHIKTHETSITKVFLTIVYKKINLQFLSSPINELLANLKYAVKLVELRIKGSFCLLPLVSCVLLFLFDNCEQVFRKTPRLKKIGVELLKYMEKAIVYLDLFQDVRLVVSLQFHPNLKPFIEDCRSFGDLSNKFVGKAFYISFSKFFKHFFDEFNFSTLQILTKLAVLVLSKSLPPREDFESGSVRVPKRSPVYMFRKFLESMAEFALIKLLQKNTRYLGFFDCLEHLLLLDIRFFGVKKLLRVLSKLIVVHKTGIFREASLIDQYIQKTLQTLLVFSEKTKLFPDLSEDVVAFLKSRFRDHFTIFERFLVKFACNITEDVSEPKPTLADLQEGQVLKVFGSESLFYEAKAETFVIIDCLGQHTLSFAVQSDAVENRDSLEKSLRLVKYTIPCV